MAKREIVIIGAGMSGLCAGAKLRAAGIDEFTILEKMDRVGGTWRDNIYPGVACDVPSHLYSFSFAPKPDWSRMYAPGEEIRQYLEDCVRRFGLGNHIELGIHVETLEFIDARWKLTLSDGTVRTADLVISGMGGLHNPFIPDIKGADSFSGLQFHSSHWPDGLDLRGLKVGVVGTGATAVQLIPEIAPLVDQLTVFQRSAIWALPKKDPLYTEEEKQAFATDPECARAHRQQIWQESEDFSVEVVRDTERNHHFQNIATQFILDSVDDPEIARKLIPDYQYGCKRPTISNTYYATFNRPNVELVTDPVAAIEARGIRTADDRFRELDVLIFATGFKAFDISRQVTIVGQDGTTLRDAWKDRVAAHRSIMVPGFPNLFTLLGPGSAGLTSAIEMIETQCDFVVSVIDYLDKAEARYLHPKPEALEDWVDLIRQGLAGTIMNVGCHSWWTDESGYNHTAWPYSSVRFRDEVSAVRTDDYVTG